MTDDNLSNELRIANSNTKANIPDSTFVPFEEVSGLTLIIIYSTPTNRGAKFV